ncbi:MAG: chemotaxis protein CheW [bacterium]|nr:chemotaxis protein CheW [bacterium]
MPVEKLILFQINNQMYGINVDYVSAIESVTDIVRVPNAPANIEGIISLRGNVIPVYSLHKKFNTVLDTTRQESQLIITRSEDNVFAFMVDQVDEIHLMEKGQYLDPPNVLMCEKTSYIAGIAKIKDSLVLCIDVNELMSEAEKEKMQTFVEQMSNND